MTRRQIEEKRAITHIGRRENKEGKQGKKINKHREKIMRGNRKTRNIKMKEN